MTIERIIAAQSTLIAEQPAFRDHEGGLHKTSGLALEANLTKAVAALVSAKFYVEGEELDTLLAFLVNPHQDEIWNHIHALRQVIKANREAGL